VLASAFEHLLPKWQALAEVGASSLSMGHRGPRAGLCCRLRCALLGVGLRCVLAHVGPTKAPDREVAPSAAYGQRGLCPVGCDEHTRSASVLSRDRPCYHQPPTGLPP
jgi:hypothetical protein